MIEIIPSELSVGGVYFPPMLIAGLLGTAGAWLTAMLLNRYGIIMRGIWKTLLTAIIVLAAAGALAFEYWDYIANPWTRDGQVRANIIQVAPRVSGPIVKLPIKDDQFVKAGGLLFEIDPRTYQAALDQASANLDKTRDHLKDLEQQVKAAQAALDQSGSQIKQAQSAVKSAEAQSIKAAADLERAANLVAKGDVSKRTFDEAKASNDIAQADLDKAQSQLIQAKSAQLQAEAELAGVVDSIGWGIAQQDGSTGQDLLPSISPTFEWIRLAQRVPVRVHLEKVPEGVELRVGTTASVLVMTGASDGNGETAIAPAPTALQ